METDPKMLEKEAISFLSDGKYTEAYKYFDRAATQYKRAGNHKQAALCFASAASCWGMQCGEKRFFNAASANENAAKQALACGDLEYASLLYKHAAINYERDGEFINLSDCAYRAKECYRRFLTYYFFKPSQINHIVISKEKRGFKAMIKRFFLWSLLTLSCLVWGHAEFPSRVFYSGMVVIFTSAIVYSFSNLIKDGLLIRPNFFEALYFSIITFTTVGYGDITPLGISRAFASLEAFCGVFFIPIFIISLARKYLRI